MKTKLTPRFLFLLLTAAFTAFACALPAAVQAPPRETSPTPSAPNSTPSGKAGAGEAVLPNPSAGLAELKAYYAIIRVDATGKLDGQPFERHTQIAITRASNGDFDSQTQLAGSGPSARLLALDGAFYRWSGEKPACEGSVDPPAEDELIEPAGLMLPVGSASRVGVETVGEVSSVHYRFDQTGLTHFKANGPITGDLWIAESGGYVVKYILQAGAPPTAPATGLDVAQTYTYELPPGGAAPGLPEGCSRVPVDLPVISGAQNVARGAGLVTYTTGSTPRAVFDFYTQKLPGLGWKSEISVPEGEIKLPYFIQFSRDQLRLTLNLSANEDNSLGVELAQVDLSALPEAPPPEASPTPAGTPTPEPTANPAESGLPSGVPLYPGATGLFKTSGAVMFTSPDPMKDVAAFYKEQLTTNGWTNLDEVSIPDGTNQTWQKGDTLIMVTIMEKDGKILVVVTNAN